MIREIATLTIEPGNASAFEAAVTEAKPLFLGAAGCHAMHLERVIEKPGQYRLVVEWESVEAHTEVFRTSEAFQTWRGLVQPFFVAPPDVVHTEVAVE